MNTKQYGAIAVAKAIAYFTEQGYNVSVPISDVQRYDLIIEENGVLSKVEVKSTNFKRYQNYQVQLATCGGNQSGAQKKLTINSKDCDLVFIYCFDGTQYLIPSYILEGKSNITLGSKYESYILAG